METQSNTTVGLNEKILGIIEDKTYSVDNIICKHSVKGQEKAANAIVRLVLQTQIDLLNELSDEFEQKWMLSAMARIEIKKENIENKLEQLNQ